MLLFVLLPLYTGTNLCTQGRNIYGSVECREDFPRCASTAFSIIVLTMNRKNSLLRLLASIEHANYSATRVRLIIRVDGTDNNKNTIAAARDFTFSHGCKQVIISRRRHGLRAAWFNAWTPATDEHAIILEDDVELSPDWFIWITRAWTAYGNRTNLAGVSLQRQTSKMLLPHSIHWTFPEQNTPFLYKLVGSIGFSPHPDQWRSFLNWLKSIDLNTFDPTFHPNLRNLQTSQWFKRIAPSSWWTVYFIYFCEINRLYTLYMHPPNNTAIATHWSEPGEHFKGPSSADFPLAQFITLNFPPVLNSYGWDGQKEKPPTLVVMGTARNVAKHSNATVAAIELLQTKFTLLKIFVFESESSDNTVLQLRQWKNTQVISPPPQTKPSSRTARLAHGRNQLWQAVRSMPHPPQYVLMLDLDGVNDFLRGVETCLNLPAGWGGCCANQRTTYYDLWALRTYDDWVDCDVWFECTANRDRRFRHIDRNAAPIKVRSCFGGAALYNYASIRPNATYIGTVNGHQQCEHVAFHEHLGGDMYIQPSMLNDAPNEHLPKQLRHPRSLRI